jgi:flagellar basal body rod protein FlgC
MRALVTDPIWQMPDHSWCGDRPLTLRRKAHIMDMDDALAIAARGMLAEVQRLRIAADKSARQTITGDVPAAAPDRRQTVDAAEQLDGAMGAPTLDVGSLLRDPSSSPAGLLAPGPADAAGTLLPDLGAVVGIRDVRAAERSHRTNLGIIQVTRETLLRAVQMLDAG